MRALSIRQPYAELILRGINPIKLLVRDVAVAEDLAEQAGASRFTGEIQKGREWGRESFNRSML